MLNCIMAQCGLHVTCKQADICMNSAYLCDIGDGQNLSENLSTFSAHITNVLEILKEANADSFVIMDELGSGTDPYCIKCGSCNIVCGSCFFMLCGDIFMGRSR